jgi:serine/threonine protein kinase
MELVRDTLIKRGGQGEVWRGEASDGAPVAIKYLLLPTGVDDPSKELRRFKREINCQRDLTHTGIVTILSTDLKADRPFYVMPLAENSLRGILDDQVGALPESESIRIFIAVLEAIAYAHRHGVIHRDLKPENILFFGGEPKVSDFGLGRRLMSGSTTITIADGGLGTLQYAAPEQLTNAHSVDERADVFSLGRILFELLSGEQAFPFQDLLKVPARYRQVVMTAMDFNIEQRYQSVSELLREVRILANDMEQLRSPASRIEALISAYKTKQNTSADEFAVARILIEAADDAHVYTQILPEAPSSMLEEMARRSIGNFRLIVRQFCNHADSQFQFEHVDTLGRFLKRSYYAHEDIETRKMLLTRLLLLGSTHNRWAVRHMFVELATDALKTDETYALILARLFRAETDAKEFVSDALLRLSLPPVLAEELAA